MECSDKWVCLCAYFIDGEPDPEEIKAIEKSENLCPKCRSCSKFDRQQEIRHQQYARALIQERFPDVTAPNFFRENMMFELGRAEEYRESGIQILGLVRWGTHIAQIYRDKNELTEVLVPYIEKGLEDNELCAWITSEISEEEARDTLAMRIPDAQKYIDSGQLQLSSFQNMCMTNGRFNMQYALEGAIKKYQEALFKGYSGLRITGNVFWLDGSDWDSFMQYENLLDNAIRKIKALVVCGYKETECTRNNIVDIMDRHMYVISKMDDLWQLQKSESHKMRRY